MAFYFEDFKDQLDSDEESKFTDKLLRQTY